MTWAGRRRLIVAGVFGAMLALVTVIVYFATFYRAPACTDGIKNGKETGVDCGGTCPYLCTGDEEPPTILFTQAVLNGEGRTDVVSLVENKNQDAAAKDVPYAIAVYGYDQRLIQRVTGTLDLPPGATEPVFVSGISSGFATPGASFLTIDASTTNWYALSKDPRIVPKVSDVTVMGASTTPRITARLSNPDVRDMRNIKAIVVVENAAGNAIAASQTVLATIPAQGSATATFTWNAPFSGEPVTIKVLPVIPLP